MSGSLAGAAVGIALVVDAFTDPPAGSLSDHWKSRYGRRHPFMYASILPLMVSFYFLFNPLVTSEFGLFIWLVVFSNATRTAMSLYHVPHIALGAEMSEDYDERSKLGGLPDVFRQRRGAVHVRRRVPVLLHADSRVRERPTQRGCLSKLRPAAGGPDGGDHLLERLGNTGRDSVPARRASHTAASASARCSGASSSTSSPPCAAAPSAGCSSGCSSCSSWLG